jgi:large subunit ribosomal protein L22
MEVKTTTKYNRISPQKARQVTRAITGMSVNQAISTLHFTPKKAANLIGKTLKTALADASNNFSLSIEDLYIKSCVAVPGPTIKRILPRARGSASPIRKRMTHITLILAPVKEAAAEK